MAAMPAVVVATLADALFLSSPAALWPTLGLLSAVALVSGLVVGLAWIGLAAGPRPVARLGSLWRAAGRDPEIDALAGAWALAAPLGLGLVVLGLAWTHLAWIRDMVNPTLAALATGIMAVVWLAPAALGASFVAALIEPPLERVARSRHRAALVLGLVLDGLGGIAAVVWVASRVALEALPLGALGVLAALVVVQVAAAWWASTLRCRWPWAPGAWAALVSLALVGLTWAAVIGFDPSGVGERAVLSSRSLSRRVVLVGRSLLDRDGDGYAALLGGGDCDDTDEDVNPGAQEIPGDGIDNNCMNGDAPKPEATEQVEHGDAHGPSGPVNRPQADAGQASSAEVADQETNQPAKPAPMNVVAILVDTLRADHVGAYGYERDTTPNIDALAKQAILFERCYAQSPHTPRSIPSIMTSRYPSHIDWWGPRRSYPKLKPSNLTLAEHLSANGVHTRLVASHFYFVPGKYGITQGFDVVDDKGAKSLPDSNKDTASPRIYAKLVRHLEKLAAMSKEGKRFFLFVHLFEPHSTYMRHRPPDFFGKGWMDLYDGEIHYADRYVGKILHKLDELGLSGSSAVMIFADHGEGNGEHGFKWHGQHIYNEVMHVPLVIRVPGLEPRRISTPVALLDVAPTIADLVGVGPAASFEGRSLVPGLVGRDLPEVPIYGQLLPYPYCKEEAHSLILGDWKVLYDRTGNTWSLFDLSKDPLEAKDLAAKVPEVLSRMQTRLTTWLETGR